MSKLVLNQRGQPRLTSFCTRCSVHYLARQANSKLCDACRCFLNEKILCECGCGRFTQRKHNNGYRGQCQKRGKTYKEIYGDKEIKCGFKKGELNPNYTRSPFIGRTLINSKGESYRSSLEVFFSEFCIRNNISYEYEVKTKLCNGKLKIVDFVLEGYIYVEISGFAYLKWQLDFINKMRLLRQSVSNPILILTYQKHLVDGDREISITQSNIDKDMFFEDIVQENKILTKIQMFNFMKTFNDKILNLCN